ncbi:hypothetical protein LWC35_18565 [Pseudonocardia kujensis]|uniref:hypothetical protein n=1 Tax=Pseudonocardia kujensis TaxID=1128675 RepID=UPI001E5ACF8A|nr:hypothetical protein [Pseudonocardia kujensis]MCE0764892.1 hypothetical protein [Pseudonocardia kujensis]
MSQPRRNERRFYLYPQRRVVAVLDDDAGVQLVVDGLGQAGLDVAKVNVLSGPEGARLLDPAGTRHGPGARFMRFLQRGVFEGEALRVHERALNAGHHVVYVPVRNDEQQAQVVQILRSAGGYALLRFRRWSVELLPPV